MEDCYLIVGLGNPGKEYAQTRHNAGFLVTEALVGRWHSAWRLERRFSARVARTDRNGKRVLLCQPQTFMNASGEAVRQLVDYYRVTTDKILVVVDDADLPLGTIRLRPSGSPGGHHGLESIEQHLGSREYARLRVGIGRQAGAREITGHVLGRFNSTEAALMDRVFDAASNQVECWLDEGLAKAMSVFNGVVNDPENEGKEK
jgi:peptidyl-tRNA hydrolase, PTH1 family